MKRLGILLGLSTIILFLNACRAEPIILTSTVVVSPTPPSLLRPTSTKIPVPVTPTMTPDIQLQPEKVVTQPECDTLQQIVYSPSGERLAVATSEGVSIYETGNLELETTLPTEYVILSIAWSPVGEWLAGGYANGWVTVWNGMTGENVVNLPGCNCISEWVNSVAWSPDGERIASGGATTGGAIDAGGIVHIYETVTGKEMAAFTGYPAEVTSVVWSPDGTQVAAGLADGTVLVWNLITGEEMAAFTDHIPSAAVAWSPNGDLLLSGGVDGRVRAWDLETKEELHLFTANSNDMVTSLTWSPDGKWLAGGTRELLPNGYAGDSGTVQVWDMTTWKLAALTNSIDWVNTVAWSPDGKHLASGSGDSCSLLLWNVSHLIPILTTPAP